MGVYEDCRSSRDMYWFGSTEVAYEPSCNTCPPMPHLHRHQFRALDTPVSGSPMTRSSSTSSLPPSVTPHPPAILSPDSDRSQFVDSPAIDTDSGLQSPVDSGPQDLSSSSVSVTTSSQVFRATTSIATNSGDASFCAGCSDRIIDRYYLLAVERRWHPGCLRCAVCRLPLDTAATCFAKDGNIFCKEDYQRLFCFRSCSRCEHGIGSSELVMRARQYVYHVQCFSCAHCNLRLTKGDTFGMNGPQIYCRDHYQIAVAAVEAGRLSPLGVPQGPFQTPPLPPGAPVPPHLPHFPPEALRGFSPSESMAKLQFLNGVGAPHKGRPRKRKPKEEPMDTNMNISSGYDLEGPYGPLGSNCQPVRTKRIRTSFKHHQLRTMKAYFQMNHNPDAKDLKQLSQKTSLSKRVLQVWFQNARAKWRRQLITKDPKLLNGGEGGPSSCHDGSGPECSGTEYGSNLSPSVGPPMSPEEESSATGAKVNSQLHYQQMF